VKPEAERSLEKADQCLSTARAELDINLSSEAGRNAYLAAFHAARAFIFERNGKYQKACGRPARIYPLGKRRAGHRQEFPSLSRASVQPESRVWLITKRAPSLSSLPNAPPPHWRRRTRFVDSIRKLLTPRAPQS